MTLNLPADIAFVLKPLFDALPLDRAMTQLVVTRGGATEIVEKIVGEKLIAAKPALVAGLWLYIDQLDRSHEVSQAMEDQTGSFWHGIMHRREGDFWNSHYWFRRVGAHPAMKTIEGYDAHRLIDEVEAAQKKGESPVGLVEMQRREWARLMEWCAAHRAAT